MGCLFGRGDLIRRGGNVRSGIQGRAVQGNRCERLGHGVVVAGLAWSMLDTILESGSFLYVTEEPVFMYKKGACGVLTESGWVPFCGQDRFGEGAFAFE